MLNNQRLSHREIWKNAFLFTLCAAPKGFAGGGFFGLLISTFDKSVPYLGCGDGSIDCNVGFGSLYVGGALTVYSFGYSLWAGYHGIQLDSVSEACKFPLAF